MIVASAQTTAGLIRRGCASEASKASRSVRTCSLRFGCLLACSAPMCHANCDRPLSDPLCCAALSDRHFRFSTPGACVRGPHDLRHPYATWLEEAGIPTRVIDELMGHSGGARDGSPMGRTYRHTTPEMLSRVVEAVEKRLGIALDVPRCGPTSPERWTATPEPARTSELTCGFVWWS
jgi:Phage integrase family